MEKKEKKNKNFKDVIIKKINLDDITSFFDKKEVEENMKYSILSYIGFLFLIPLLKGVHRESKYVLFHVNQGLNLFIIELFCWLLIGILNSLFCKYNYIPNWISLISFIFYAIISVIAILGIVNAVNGKSKKLPFIGKIKLIK